MDDEKILDLYWARNEDAIRETSSKYGNLCSYIAGNILVSPEDREECVNDTWLGAWNAIPPHRPSRFSLFLGKITRNLALKKLTYRSAAKRNSNAVCSLEELGDCVSGTQSVENELENKRIEQTISAFLQQQSEEKRAVFLYRYWYFESIAGICVRTGYSEGKVKSMLYHTREKLRIYLEKEGIEL